jgi:hypothetical protein
MLRRREERRGQSIMEKANGRGGNQRGREARERPEELGHWMTWVRIYVK